MRRDKSVDCEACWQRDCDCECRTCSAARIRRSLGTEALTMMNNTQVVGEFANQPRLTRRA